LCSSAEELNNINIEDLGSTLCGGRQEPYAGGWKLNGLEDGNTISEYFIIDYDKNDRF
jgi:hypothetical protein